MLASPLPALALFIPSRSSEQPRSASPPGRWREPSGPRRAGGGTSCALADEYACPRAGGAASSPPCAAPLCSSPALLHRPDGSVRPSAAALPATERPRPGGAAGLDVGAALAERDVSPAGVDGANEPPGRFGATPRDPGTRLGGGRRPRRSPCRCRHRSAGSPAGQAASLTRRERRDGGLTKCAALHIPHTAASRQLPVRCPRFLPAAAGRGKAPQEAEVAGSVLKSPLGTGCGAPSVLKQRARPCSVCPPASSVPSCAKALAVLPVRLCRNAWRFPRLFFVSLHSTVSESPVSKRFQSD